MKVLIAGGTGFLGGTLEKSLLEDGHEPIVLTRHGPANHRQVHWDGITTDGWGNQVNQVDAVVHLTGHGLEHWPWTRLQKRRFVDSRVLPARALASAIEAASRRPPVFLHHSGINYYGLRGDAVADESTPPADDFLARLTVEAEEASLPVEELGVRRIVARSAVVLASRGGLFPLIALPAKMFFGGRFGDGKQSFNWIHATDHIRALRFLLQNETVHGVYNLVAPQLTSLDDLMRVLTRALGRPYWFHLPAFLLRITMGGMSVLLTHGRFAQPRRLLEAGFDYQFPQLEEAMTNLLNSRGV